MHMKEWKNKMAFAALIVFLGSLAFPGSALVVNGATSIQQLLQSRPMSLDTYGSIYEGYQYIDDIPRNLESLYGVGSVLEVPFVGNREGPFPSKEMEYVPLKADEDTTLRQFLDSACSDGKLAWGIVQNAIHIWPTYMPPGKEEYLDTVKISLDLKGVSLLDAAKAWAVAVNENRTFPGYGVRINHPSAGVCVMRNIATPPSLTREGAVTLKLDNVTAREALCAIQGASKEWLWIAYHSLSHFPDGVIFAPSQAAIDEMPEISADERQALDVQEDLKSVLVPPKEEAAEGK
jgi:hypothetical protein